MVSRQSEQLKGRAARLTRLMPSGPSNAARTPFVLLVVLLLGGGLISLLVLNSALNEGSFKLSELKRATTDLTDEQQALQRDVDSYSEPDALERRARELGMVPGGSPAFLDPDGTVRGVPARTTAEPAPPKPKPEPEPTPEPGVSGSGSAPSPTPSPTASPTTTTTTTPTTPPPSAPVSGQAAGNAGSTPGGSRTTPPVPQRTTATPSPSSYGR